MPVISRRPSRATGASRCSFGSVLRAGGVGMRHPDGRHAEDIGEDLVRQRAAEIGQHVAASGRQSSRSSSAANLAHGFSGSSRVAFMITSRACSTSIVAEAVLLEVPAQRRDDVVRIGADHEAQLAVGDGAGRNGIDRPVGIAGLEGQHLEAVPAEHALDRRQASRPSPHRSRARPRRHRSTRRRAPRAPSWSASWAAIPAL